MWKTIHFWIVLPHPNIFLIYIVCSNLSYFLFFKDSRDSVTRCDSISECIMVTLLNRYQMLLRQMMRTGRPWGTNRSFAYLNSWNYDSNHNTSQQPWCSSKIQETDRNSPQTENNRPSDDNQPVTILRHKWVHCLLGKFWSSKIWTRTMIRDAIDQQQSKLPVSLYHFFSPLCATHWQHTGVSFAKVK